MRIAKTLLIAALVLPTAARAQNVDAETGVVPTDVDLSVLSPGVLDQARLLLSAYHALPTRTQLESALGPDARAALWAIVGSDDELAIHRDRALVALAAWPDEGLRLYLDHVLATVGEDDMDRHRAISVYAAAFGDASLDVLAPMLTEGSLQVRLTAIDAIESIGTPTAALALQTARPLVVDRLAADHLERALRALETVRP